MKKHCTPLNAADFKPKTLVLAVKKALPYLVALSLGAAVVSPAVGRSGDSAAAFTATQLIRQFTLKNTVAQVSQGMQGSVQEVNGVLRAVGMGGAPSGYPVDMGSVPSSANLPQRDGAGRPLGYCAWDNSSSTSNASFLAGLGTPSPLVYAVVSPGLNGSMETSCAHILSTRTGLGDDYVQVTAPSQTSSRQFRSAVGTYADLAGMPADEGDIRLVLENNRLYSYVGGAWQPVDGSRFSDDSASNGVGAIAYTTGKVTVADFQAASATISGALAGSTATFSSSVTANSFVGNGAGLTDLNASNISSGVLGAAFGGTGVDGSAAAAGSLLIGTGAGYALGSITAGDGIGILNGAGSITISNTGVLSIAGTSNQITASAANGDVVLSLPQDIATTSMPTFGGMTLNGPLMGTTGTFSGAVAANNLRVAAGSATAPGYGFSNDTDTGFYSPGDGRLAATVNGVQSMDINGSNTAFGRAALIGNNGGAGNSAFGGLALSSNTTGNWNTATGQSALRENVSGGQNTATGHSALHHNTSGNSNTASGFYSLFNNTTGNWNTSTGQNAMRENVDGGNNTAVGHSALHFNTSGSNNTANGFYSLMKYTSGSSNVASGYYAGFTTNNFPTSSGNTFIGANATIADTAAMAASGRITLLGHGATASGLDAALANAYMTAVGSLASVVTPNTVVLGRTTDTTVIGATGTASSGILQNKILQVTGDVGISGALTIGGTFTATGFSGNGSGLTDLNASNISTGTLGVARGGTGVDGSAAANGALLIGNGSGYTLGTLTGTANQVNVTNGAGSITLSLPQSIATTSTPTFGGMTLNGALTGTTGTFSGAVTAQRLNVVDTTGVTNGNLIVGTGAMPGAQSGLGGNTALGISALAANTSGGYNTAVGTASLFSNTTGIRNTASGYRALYSNTEGNNNTASGDRALYFNTTGSENTAVGQRALYANTTGINNNALGLESLLANTTGSDNTAIGARSMRANTTGSSNVAVGNVSLFSNTTGTYNTALGFRTLYDNTSGNYNTAVGYRALNSNTTGSSNIAMGSDSLRNNITGNNNLAIGPDSLFANTAGHNNLAIGPDSLLANTTGNNNLALGIDAGDTNTTGSNNTLVGTLADVASGSLSYATALGSNAVVSTNNSIVLGRTTDTTVIGATGTASSGILQNKILQVTGDVGISGALTIGGTFTATGFSGNGSGLTDLNASNISTGTLGVARGGTGVDGSAAANGALLIGNGSGYTLGTLTGTANQVAVTNGAGSITLSLPQSIATTSTPTFGGLTLNGAISGTSGVFNASLTATRMVLSDSTGVFNPNLIIGFGAMDRPASGSGRNTAVGINALRRNTSGRDNVALGDGAVYSNSTGEGNVGVGSRVMYFNDTGYRNTAVGQNSLYYNTSGHNNVAIGPSVLLDNTTGYSNIASGWQALRINTTGNENVAIGVEALDSNVTGSRNSAFGDGADVASGNLGYATVIGAQALVSTSNTIVLGRTIDTTVIGATGTASSGILQNKILQVTGDVGISGALTIGGTFTATGFSGNGSGLTDLNASNISTGTLGVARGGTGVDGSAAANGALLIGNGSGYTLGTLTGTANQVNVTNGAGSITLSLPQSIATTSTPTFGGMTLNGALTGTTGTFSGAVTAQRLNVVDTTGVTNGNLIVGTGAMPGAQSGLGGNTALGISALAANTSGGYNTAVGTASLFSNTTGIRNTASGYQALYSNTTGSDNDALGFESMLSNTTGSENTSIGARSLRANTTGSGNVAVGLSSLRSNTTGIYNTASGLRALYFNTTGNNNSATGYRALYSNTTGINNVAMGSNSLFNNTTAQDNTAIGINSLFSNTIGEANIAVGNSSLYSNTTGIRNTALGVGSLSQNTMGNLNAALGHGSMLLTTTGSSNVALGAAALSANTTGNNNLALGVDAGDTNTTGSNNTLIGWRSDVASGNLSYASALGSGALVSTSNTVVLGRSGTTDQVVIGAASRNDTITNTVFHVAGVSNFTSTLYATGGAEVSTNQLLRFGAAREGTDTVGIYRTNTVADQSLLRIAIGDNSNPFGAASADEFQVGRLNIDDTFNPVFRVAGSGDVIAAGYVQATAFNVSSDRRLKTNIQAQDSSSVLNRLEQLQTYSYEYQANPNLGRRIGVMAQEIQNLFPEAVATRADGMMSVDYSALGAMAAMGVGQLSKQVKVLDKTVAEQGQRITVLDDRVNQHDTRITSLEGWKTEASKRMDGMQNAIDLNIQEIAKNTVAIQINSTAIERLDDALFTLDGQVKNNSDAINSMNARWARNFSESEDGSVLAVNAVELKVSNITAQQLRANSVYSQRLEAEIARIADLEVNNLKANSAVANTVQAEQVNTGSTQVYAGVGLPAVLFAAKSDGHYTVSTSAIDGSYATATVIVNAGQAKVVSVASEGIELYAEGNQVKVIAAGKSIKASWIKMG